MTSGREEPKREFGSKGKNLMGGGAPNSTSVGWRDQPGHRRTLREIETPKGGERKLRVPVYETPKRKKTRRVIIVGNG